MRTLLLTALLGGALATTAQAGPPGYHAPRRLFTSKHQAYERLPLRLSFGLNTAYYNGDITGRFQDNTYQVGFDLGMVYTYSPRVTLGIEATYFQLKAKDSNADRGLRFVSSNYMLVPFLRYNLLEDKSMLLGTAYEPQRFQVYLQAGIGAVIYNPKAYQTSNGIFPLITESKAAYPATAAVLPVGIGASYRVSSGVYLSLEGQYYFASTDLLDDVSQRGDSKTLDQFAIARFKMEFTIPHKHGKPLVRFD
ncbi:MAG: hypothetical protein ACRYFX_04285 [Janthinobacterium lividum]